MLKLFNFFIRYFKNSGCTTLQTHVRIQFDVRYGEIDACSRNIGMKIDTFVDFISTWINLPRQKIVWKYIIVQYIKSISHLLKYYPQIYDIQQSIIRKCPAF